MALCAHSLETCFQLFNVKSLTSIWPFILDDFVRKVSTVEFFTLRQNDNTKYSTKRSDVTPKERHVFGRQQTRRMAYRDVSSSSEEQRTLYALVRRTHALGTRALSAHHELIVMSELSRQGSTHAFDWPSGK
jgi:hypothetical protein